MRKSILTLVVSALLLVMTFSVAACGVEAKDVVNGVRPASAAMREIRISMEELAALPPNERAAHLRRDWPHLEDSVVYFLRSQNRIPGNGHVDRVEFLFGSLDQVRAYDGDGTLHNGYFRNQLVARVHVRGENAPVDVIVQCLNGMMTLPGMSDRLQSLGSYVPAQRFTIRAGEGLIHHVDFPTAIDLAARFNLSLYRGRRIEPQFLITPTAARQLESRTDWEQITVYVVEGDQFDLVNMTFVRSPRRR